MAFNGTDVTELYEESDADMPGEEDPKDEDPQDDESTGDKGSTAQKKKWFDVAKATTAAVRAWTVRYNNTFSSFETHVSNLEALLGKTGGTEVC